MLHVARPMHLAKLSSPNLLVSAVRLAPTSRSPVPHGLTQPLSNRKVTCKPQANPPCSLHRPVVASFALDPDREALQKSAGLQRTLSFVAFWLQLALSISAAGVLLFSVGFTAQVPSRGMDISKWLSLVGIALAFISSFFAHGFLNLANKIQAGGAVSRAWITQTLITNNSLNLMGILATAIGLQASVGTLVAKSLMSTAMAAQPYQNTSLLASIDVFGLQASTNSLLCHIVSLLFTNIMLRILTPKASPPPPDFNPSAPPLAA